MSIPDSKAFAFIGWGGEFAHKAVEHGQSEGRALYHRGTLDESVPRGNSQFLLAERADTISKGTKLVSGEKIAARVHIEKPTCRSCECGGAVTALSNASQSPMKTTCSIPLVNAV